MITIWRKYLLVFAFLVLAGAPKSWGLQVYDLFASPQQPGTSAVQQKGPGPALEQPSITSLRCSPGKEKPFEQAAMVKRAETAVREENWPQAITLFQQLIKSHEHWEFYDALAYSQLKQARTQADADSEYRQALQNYEKAIDLMKQRLDAGGQDAVNNCSYAHMLSNEGYIHLHFYLKGRNAPDEKDKIGGEYCDPKTGDAGEVGHALKAIEAYCKAVGSDPQQSIVAHHNLCVAYWDVGNSRFAKEACNQTIKACDEAANNRDKSQKLDASIDLLKADAYFIKGLATFSERTSDEDTAEAITDFRTYCQLASDGPYRDAARERLRFLKAEPESCGEQNK